MLVDGAKAICLQFLLVHNKTQESKYIFANIKKYKRNT